MATKPLDQLSPAYRRRIERAMAKGKTRQAARGHKVKEHVERKQKEIAKRGISDAQIKSIHNFYKRFNPNNQKGKPDVEQFVDYARQKGYGAFVAYRERWTKLRRDYVRSKLNGTYVSKSAEQFEKEQKASARRKTLGGGGGGGGGGDRIRQTEQDYGDDYDIDFEDYEYDDVPDISWLYYH